MPVESLSQLVVDRKACRICVDKDPGKIFNGSQKDFDPPVVSYWSQWLGNPKPLVLVVGQDFSNFAYFEKNQGKVGAQANKNLYELLTVAGITVGPPPFSDHKAPVFLTNSILCLKAGSMSGPIKNSWVRDCSDNRLPPLVQFLSPKIVIGMGRHGWFAVRRLFKLTDAPLSIKQAAGRPWPVGDQTIFAVGHCSGLGLI